MKSAHRKNSVRGAPKEEKIMPNTSYEKDGDQ